MPSYTHPMHNIANTKRTHDRTIDRPPYRSIIQDNQDMDVALVKYRVSAVQVHTPTKGHIRAKELTTTYS